MQEPLTRCPMCGAALPPECAGCRDMFEAVLAREFTDPRYTGVHLLTVDAYVLQHSEQHGPRSNAFHLARLCLIFEHGAPAASARWSSRQAAKHFEGLYRRYPFLPAPADRGKLTIADVYGASTPEEHVRCVRLWAASVWEAWAAHHDWARRAAADFPGR